MQKKMARFRVLATKMFKRFTDNVNAISYTAITNQLNE